MLTLRASLGSFPDIALDRADVSDSTSSARILLIAAQIRELHELAYKKYNEIVFLTCHVVDR